MLRAGPKGNDHAGLPELPVDDVEWFEHVTGTTLYGWQREELRKAMAPDRPEAYYLQVGRKNGKSYLAAAVGICQARRPGQHIYMVSDSERTLTNALFREMKGIIARSPILAAAFVPFQTKFEIPATGSFIQANTSRHSASQGVNPDLVLFDEVHLQKDMETWSGYVQSIVAKPGAMVYGITTPGQDITGPAHGLYEAVKAGGLAGRIFEPHDPNTAYTDRSQWPQANPRLADDPAFMDALEKNHASVNVAEYQFKRYHLGMWTAGATAWLPYGALNACTYPKRLEHGQAVWLGFDGSVSGDSTALVAHWDGHMTVLGCWENPGKKDWLVPKDEVMDAVDKAFSDYRVVCMYMDTSFWQREFQEWERLYGGERVVQFRQTPVSMGPACEAYREAVVTGRISHDGDPRFTRHHANAVVRETPYGVMIMKVNKDSPAKIDIAVASVMAYAANAAWPDKPRSIGVF